MAPWMETNSMASWTRRALCMSVALLVLVACSGPENRDTPEPTSTPVPTTAPTEEEAAATPTEAVGEAIEETATPTEAASATPEETATPTEEPPTPTPEPSPTATPVPLALDESLPGADQLPSPGYVLANQGTRTALELANSYADSSAHLERLNDWGFREHHFREFSRDAANPEEPEPYYVLTTVNEYGGAEEAAAALAWLRSLNASQGHAFVDPAPEIGEAASASTVATADGMPTAFVAVQLGPRVYVYFAQGGEPLEFCLTLAETNSARIGVPDAPADDPEEATEEPTEREAPTTEEEEEPTTAP